ncbi:MAG: hypothetical protein HY258_05515 [Chloroflexi bacterium]|nr:hypothetical protein [Chloroflexota bacterium]
MVTYGTSYDFDSDTLSQGSTLVSRTNWLVNATRATVNYYDLFYHRFGSPTTADYTNPVLVSQPASRATPYYVLGDMTTSGDWSVGSGQTILFIVNGNLTIGGRITITGTGFVGFIVNGNIVVDSAVGTTVGSATPVVDGVYIVSPTGTFRTGASTAAATAKFVGRGMFIAGDL